MGIRFFMVVEILDGLVQGIMEKFSRMTWEGTSWYTTELWYSDVFPDRQVSMTTRGPLLMNEIIWDKDGRPTIEGGVPSTTQKVAPYYHDWPK
jgi:hypothetical protein